MSNDLIKSIANDVSASETSTDTEDLLRKLVRESHEFLYCIHCWRQGGMRVEGVQQAEQRFKAVVALAKKWEANNGQ